MGHQFELNAFSDDLFQVSRFDMPKFCGVGSAIVAGVSIDGNKREGAG
jgi:hypothetical protein